MATPQVAGAAAVLLQSHPTWTVQEIKSALVPTADPATFPAHEAPTLREGGGRIDLPRRHPLSSRCRPALLSLVGAAATQTVRSRRRRRRPAPWTVTMQAQQTPPAGVVAWAGRRRPSSPGELGRHRPCRCPRRRLKAKATGFVVLTRGTDVRHVPYWFRVESPKLGTSSRRARSRVRASTNGNTRGKPSLVSSYRYPPRRPRPACRSRPPSVDRSRSSASGSRPLGRELRRGRGLARERRSGIAAPSPRPATRIVSSGTRDCRSTRTRTRTSERPEARRRCGPPHNRRLRLRVRHLERGAAPPARSRSVSGSTTRRLRRSSCCTHTVTAIDPLKLSRGSPRQRPPASTRSRSRSRSTASSPVPPLQHGILTVPPREARAGVTHRPTPLGGGLPGDEEHGRRAGRRDPEHAGLHDDLPARPLATARSVSSIVGRLARSRSTLAAKSSASLSPTTRSVDLFPRFARSRRFRRATPFRTAAPGAAIRRPL